ncbi:MAG: hypothetical protein ACTSXQ_07990 [Alphaproteobacteria bacterium]
MLPNIKMSLAPVHVENRVNPYASMMDTLMETGNTGNHEMDSAIAKKMQYLSLKQR